MRKNVSGRRKSSSIRDTLVYLNKESPSNMMRDYDLIQTYMKGSASL